MKTLLEGPGRMRFHTELRPLFEAIGDRLEPLRWRVTDWECNHGKFACDVAMGEPWVVSGADLRRIAEGYDAPQFIWGVLSGFPPGTAFPPRGRQGRRNAAEDPVWDPTAPCEYPDAQIEIFGFDGGATIVTCDDAELHRRLRAYFPEAKPMPPPRPRSGR